MSTSMIKRYIGACILLFLLGFQGVLAQVSVPVVSPPLNHVITVGPNKHANGWGAQLNFELRLAKRWSAVAAVGGYNRQTRGEGYHSRNTRLFGDLGARWYPVIFAGSVLKGPFAGLQMGVQRGWGKQLGDIVGTEFSSRFWQGGATVGFQWPIFWRCIVFGAAGVGYYWGQTHQAFIYPSVVPDQDGSDAGFSWIGSGGIGWAF